jgi:NAD-dependent dihydropyrimidine dehydrogenase PreA subunit
MKVEKSDKATQRAFRGVRLAVLGVSLVVATTAAILHQRLPGTKPVGVDALCPFGAIESAIALAVTGGLLAKIAWTSFVLLGATIVMALVFRRVFCGKVCAFGALQELFARLGKLIFRKRLTVPKAIDRPARYLKYLALLVIVVLSAVLGTLVIRPYDPWAAWNHLLSVELITGFLVGLVILVVSLVGSLLYDRFFCKYLCPMGGFLGLINRLGWFRVKRNDATCTHCMACNKACPVNIPVESVAQVQSSECIACNLCVAACPVKDTLYVGGPRKGKVPPFAVLGITVAIFAAVVAGSSFIPGVAWTQKTLEATVGETNSFNPDDIKGSDTFKSVSEVSGIPMPAFLEAFGITADQFEAPIRDAAHAAGSTFDTDAVRAFVRGRLK